MTPDDFAAWLAQMKAERNWSIARCLRELEASTNQAIRWRAKAPPRYIALACTALCNELPPYGAPERS